MGEVGGEGGEVGGEGGEVGGEGDEVRGGVGGGRIQRNPYLIN